MSSTGVKGWREVRAENSSRVSPWYYRHTKLAIREYSLNIGISRGFFFLSMGLGTHRFVFDRHKVRKGE